MAKLRTFTLYIVLPVAFGAVLFLAGFLQEFSGDEIPDAARAAGVTLPLSEAHIVVSCQRMTLSLFSGDALIKRYNIGYGRGPVGRITKRAGSTPIGNFTIIKKERRGDLIGHGSRFMMFDFPSLELADQAYEVGELSDEDHEAIAAAHASVSPPPFDTPLGGPVGIQGNFFFFLDRRFTDGNIALSNADINELFEYVPVGTTVSIER